MAKYKLTYFNIKGLGEPIRYMLSYMKKDFEDERIAMDEWPARKNSTPFGKLPVLQIDGKSHSESTAICRFLAIEAGLSGRTPEENLLIDEVIGAIGDFIREITKYFKTENPEEKEKNKQTLLNELLPFYFGKFEEIMAKNNGYLANGKLSWADLYIVAWSEAVQGFLQVDLGEKFPHFKQLTEKVRSQPGIQEWIKRRPKTDY